MIGQTISHYKISEKLGEGGMGVVWKAEDTKLERTVALKFLAAHLLNDDEAKRRFLREAKAAAVLSHPNICHVYEIDEAEGKTFLAMEFVPGETLEDRIAKGPLSLKDALDIGRQVADGLEAAHEAGIVHRDIKPANILVDAKGRATIMDFGLARLTEASRLTKADTTMGTVAYMSPEQAQGLEVDHRTDIWALGCVLYEMVSGQRPFKGQYDQALLYEIVNQEPEPLTGLRTGVPVELEVFVSKCLEKAPENRYQSAGEVAVDLRTLSEKLRSGRSVAAHNVKLSRPPAVSSRRNFLVPTLLGLCVLLLALNLFHGLTPPEEAGPAVVRRFSFGGVRAEPGQTRLVAISPDGRSVAYLSDESPARIWIRAMDQERARPLDGSEGASTGPSWSPDSRSLSFAAGREIKRAAADGSSVVTLSKVAAQLFRGSWSPDGETIVFSLTMGFPTLHQVSSLGGAPELLFEPTPGNKGPGHQNAEFVLSARDRRILLYDLGSPYAKDVYVRDLDRGVVHVLVEGARPVYSPSGHVIYQTGNLEPGLFALPFSLDSLQATGKPFPIVEDGFDAHAALDGTLIYTDFTPLPPERLVWKSRRGERLGTIGLPQDSIIGPSISPDERWVAVEGTVDAESDVWLHSVDRAVNRRLTNAAGREGYAVWRTSEEITYFSTSQGSGDLFSRSADSSGEPVPRVASPLQEREHHWSADGKQLVFQRTEGNTGYDLWVAEAQTDGRLEERPFRTTTALEAKPQFSPDGAYIAYESNESGRNEIWVRRYPAGNGWQISEAGGELPRWSRDGSELYYVEDGEMHAVTLLFAPEFTIVSDEVLFADPMAGHGYDVAMDGRFVTVEKVPAEKARAPLIHVVENWYEEFRDREQE